MKKIIGAILLLAMMILSSVSVFAAGNDGSRKEMDGFPIGDNFYVYKWVSPAAGNEVTVFTVEGGKQGYAIIDIKSDDSYGEALSLAKGLISTAPDTNKNILGWGFAIRRVRV